MAWSMATLSFVNGPLLYVISASSLIIIADFTAQNLANTAWASAVMAVRDLPLIEAISSSA
eukprot:CAMPEP_0203944778 /NCGR_PEP_ID=MMETSP0359-20131031/80466_1 /ASSEMBLY_ACC=CAM_ASM_000338 /TAXON_ID=268821 /ORGANISM="Scrippsiella Hangoei, Strain SHTV-5" /LENGTH=60 /DNA_ID=CAMNT_0050875849 /DNA_START=43 /DNA_END=221 /DNA_ORIENTATION=+